MEDDDEAVKEGVDDDAAAFQEEVFELRHMLSVIDCVVCPCRLGFSISHLGDASSQPVARFCSTISLQISAPQRDLSVGPGDGVEQHCSPALAAGTADGGGG